MLVRPRLRWWYTSAGAVLCHNQFSGSGSARAKMTRMRQQFVVSSEPARSGRPHIIGGSAVGALGLLTLAIGEVPMLSLALVLVGIAFVALGAFQNSRA